MSSPPTQTEVVQHPKDKGGVMGSIRSIGRRLSGTFIGTKVLPSSKDKRSPIFSYEEDSGLLKIGGVLAQDLVDNFKTPLYVYDVNRIIENFNLYITALQKSAVNNNFILSYAIKANPSLGVLDVVRRLGLELDSTTESGTGHVSFTCTSAGEISRVQQIGVDVSQSVIFSGIGKTVEEIEYAIQSNVYIFSVESFTELEAIEAAARKLNKEVNISIRVNPEISSAVANAEGPSPMQARFGVPLKDVVEMGSRAKASAFLKVKGLSVHIQVPGSSLEPYIEARDKLLNLADTLRNETKIYLDHINLGGGFPVGLGTDLGTWVEKLTKPVSERGLRIVICPGRSLVQDAGVLLTKIVLVKKVSVPVPGSGSSSPRRGSLAGIVGGFPHSPTTTAPINFGQFDKPTNKPPPVVTKQIVILDASTHDLGNSSINPKIIVGQVTPKLLPIEFKYDFCGSTSEANDVLVRDYPLHEELKNDAIIAITDVGAYAMSVGGNYASRNRPAEVLVKDKSAHLIRERGSYAEQYLKEKAVPETSLALALPANLKEESHEDADN